MAQPELAHLELLAEVDALVDRLNRWADGAPAWQPAERCKALVRRLTQRADALRVRIEAPLVVATLGGTGAGKSALVNAIVGAEVAQTGRARPTTMRPTLVCRPGLTPEMLGIDPATVERVECDLPTLRDLVLVDCPDPDTSETAEAGNNLARLRAILPKCDVLLVAATQQKYRSARVEEELAAAAPGARLVFVQTHADLDDDIREDWRRVLGPERRDERVFRVDSLAALADAKAGVQPRGEFAALLDLLTRQMAGAAGNRIRRANFLDLAADTLASCEKRLDEALPGVRQLQTAIDEQRSCLATQIVGDMQAELLASRRPWENRLLSQVASRWGFSPFSLVLRLDIGIGGLLSGALLYRARTPAQMALWGTFQGIRSWRQRYKDDQARHAVDRAAAAGWDASDLRKAAMVIEGYVSDAGLYAASVKGDSPIFADTKIEIVPYPRIADTLATEAGAAATGFVARVSSDLDSLITNLAKRHTGWFTRWRYEFLLLAMLGVLLYRLGKNFFYDSWWAGNPVKVYGLEFYLSAIFWLALWCMFLLWAFCRRLRRGLRDQLTRLAAGWRDASLAAGLFAGIESNCRRVERFHQELDAIRADIDRLRRQLAGVVIQK